MSVTIELPKLHEAQMQIKAERKRRNVICCGRRFGKNILLQDFAAETAIAGKPVGWGAPFYKQTLDDFRDLENILAPIIKRKSISEMRLELLTGGIIQFWSLDKPGSIRGKKYSRFIVNEAGEVSNLIDIRNYITMPTLIDYKGDEYFSGTPKGMNGFFKLYNMNEDGWQRWQMSSYKNPHIPPEELDDLKNAMTERAFSQEILAQFLEGGGGVFRGVRNAVTATPQDEAIAGHSYVIGVDWGRNYDATVFAVLDETLGEIVNIVRITNTDYARQRNRLKLLHEQFNRAMVIAESNSMGQPNIEALQLSNIPVQSFNTTNATKAAAVQGLELAFERGEIGIIDDEVAINELIAYQAERLPSGLMRYNAPTGMHDDCVMAIAIAWSVMSKNAVIAWEW